MHTEILILAWSVILYLVHLFWAANLKTKQYGIEWNAGPRDAEMPPLTPHAGRVSRAQSNFLESYPIAIVALFGVVLAGRTSSTTAIGGWLWLAARVAYLPLYYAGVPVVRSLAFLASMIGLLLVLWPLLRP